MVSLWSHRKLRTVPSAQTRNKKKPLRYKEPAMSRRLMVQISAPGVSSPVFALVLVGLRKAGSNLPKTAKSTQGRDDPPPPLPPPTRACPVTLVMSQRRCFHYRTALCFASPNLLPAYAQNYFYTKNHLVA